MFNYTRDKIDILLKEYCNSTVNRTAVLNGEIGPTSHAATNYFFGSSEIQVGKQASTEYFLVSKRAVDHLAQCGNDYEFLNAFASKLENPSFGGWIVESNFFFKLTKLGSRGQPSSQSS